MKYNLLSLLLGASLFVAMLMASCGRALPSDNDTNIAPAEVYDDSTVIIVSEDAPPTISEIGDNVDQTVHRQAVAAASASQPVRRVIRETVTKPLGTVTAEDSVHSDSIILDSLPSESLPGDLPAPTDSL